MTLPKGHVLYRESHKLIYFTLVLTSRPRGPQTPRKVGHRVLDELPGDRVSPHRVPRDPALLWLHQRRHLVVALFELSVADYI